MSDPADLGRSKPVYRAPVPPPPRPDRSLIAILLLAVIALGGTIALLPGAEEKAEGLLAEGRYGEAIEILATIEDERPLDAYESYMLFKLYTLTKQPDSAAVLLGREPALQAENAWALRQLTDLYRETRDYAGEAKVLRQLYDITANANDFARLRVLYRLTGDLANEASLLAKAIDHGQASEIHIKRLAYLRSVPDANSLSSIWLSPSGPFASFAAPLSVQAIASSDLVAPTITPIE